MDKGANPAVFFDRDGTINEDVGYLSRPEGLVLINGAGDAIKRLNDTGIKAIVVSNQSGVGRGFFNEADVAAVNERLSGLLGRAGAHVDGVYWCPHHPEEDCGCRKPKTGLAERAAREHGIDLTRSYVVGDKASDIDLAGNLKAKSVLVLTGNGADEIKKLTRPPDYVARDITDAVGWILEDMKGH